MADISEPALAKALAKVKELVPTAPRLETIRCDVSKESDVQATVEAQDSWGGTDVIFNNAGIMHADDADAVDTPEVRHTKLSYWLSVGYLFYRRKFGT